MKQIFLSSSERIVGSINDFVINLDEDIIKPDTNLQHTITKLSISQATIPYTFPNIVSGINTSYSLFVGATEHAITLTEGNYNVFDLQTNLLNNLKDATKVNDSNATVEYSTITSGFTITSTVCTDVQFNLQTNKLFGFSTTAKQALTTNTISSDRVVIVIDKNDLYLRTNIQNHNIMNNALSDVYLKIPISVQPYSNIIYNENIDGENAIILQNYNLGALRIRITDKNNVLIPLQEEWNFTIRLVYQDELHKFVQERILKKIEEQTELIRLLLLQEDMKQKEKKKKAKINKLT